MPRRRALPRPRQRRAPRDSVFSSRRPRSSIRRPFLSTRSSPLRWPRASGCSRSARRGVALYFHARGERGALYAWLYILAAGRRRRGPPAWSRCCRPCARSSFAGSRTGSSFSAWLPLPFLLLGDSLGAALVAARRSAGLRRDPLDAQSWPRRCVLATGLLALATGSPGFSGAGWRSRPSSPSSLVLAVRAVPRLAGRGRLSRLPPSGTAGRRRSPREPSRSTGAPTSCCSRPSAAPPRSAPTRSPRRSPRRSGSSTDSLENALFVDVTRAGTPRAPGPRRSRAFAATCWLGLAGLAGGIAGGELLIRIFFRPVPRGRPDPALAHRRDRRVGHGAARSTPTCRRRALVKSALLCNAVGLAVNLDVLRALDPVAGSARSRARVPRAATELSP